MVYLGRAAGRQHHRFGAIGFHPLQLGVPDVSAHHSAGARQADFVRGDEVNRVAALHHANIGVSACFPHQRGLYFLTGRVRGVQDAAMAVAAFAREVIMRLALRVDLGVEQHALIDQPLHAVARVAGDEFDGLFVAQAGAGNQSVINV